MHRWVCAAIAAAAWPVAFLLGAAILSRPLVSAYEHGALPGTPASVIAWVAAGAALFSLAVCAVLWFVLIRTDIDSAESGVGITRGVQH